MTRSARIPTRVASSLAASALLSAAVGCGLVQDNNSDEPANPKDEDSAGGKPDNDSDHKWLDEDGLPDRCAQGISSPPPMKDVTTTYSEDPMPTTSGGDIPSPASFVGVSKRVFGKSGVEEWGGRYGLNFVSPTHVDYFFNSAQHRMTWRIDSPDGKVSNRLVLLRKCGSPESTVQYVFDYAYSDGKLSLVTNDGDEVYTFEQLND